MAARHSDRVRRRARELGLPFLSETGPCNAITDVPGVQVGHTTIVSPQDENVRTGVTAILPRPAAGLLHPVWAGCFDLNGNGELTGSHWIAEAGWFVGPITLTNTFSVGIAQHATVRWMVGRFPELRSGDIFFLPVAAETYDGWLNDCAGQHVAEADVVAALERASGGPVAEGNVGAGTGTVAYEFKGGIGTSSRIIRAAERTFSVGCLVQANHGLRPWLKVCGVDIGHKLPDDTFWVRERGSIIAVVATDAPLLPGQLQRLAKRAALGIGRGGTPSGNNSGDIFIAFSAANDVGSLPERARYTLCCLGNDELDPFFLAVVEAVEEAVVNALLAAETTVGFRGRRVVAIDPDRLAYIVLGRKVA